MNTALLEIVRRECFKVWSEEPIKIYLLLLEEAMAARDRIVQDARANGIICASITRDDIGAYFGWTREAVDNAFCILGQCGLIIKEVYSSCDIFKLGEVENGKIVWNKIKEFTGARKKVPVKENVDSIIESVRRINVRKQEGKGLADKARKRIIGDVFGERVVMAEKKKIPLSSIPLDRFCELYFERYASLPHGAYTTSGIKRYSGELRVYSKNFLKYHENDEDDAISTIDFAFQNLDVICDRFTISHPVEVRSIFVKAVCTKLRRWKNTGIPPKKQEKKNDYLDRFSGDEWEVPESLR